MVPSLWKKYVEIVLSENPADAKRFREKIDAAGKFSYLIRDCDFFDLQQQSLASRFEDNEITGVMNFFDANAFSKFIESGNLHEISDEGLPSIGHDLLKTQVMYMHKCVETDYGIEDKQQFYFFQKLKIAEKLFLNIRDNRDICFLNQNCYDLINSTFFMKTKTYQVLCMLHWLTHCRKSMFLPRKIR